jgi:hypothetical protein
MAGKSDFTADEWTTLMKSPVMAGLVVVAADPSGPLGILKEMFAVGKLVAETKTKGAQDPLVAALAGEIATREGAEKAKPIEIQGKKPEEARALALEQLREAAKLLDQKAPGDAAAFKQWLQEVATRVANASKEGGFLGIGGTRVSQAEQQALTDTAAALGVAKA